MRLLDLYCGAGGAAMGYYRAGFTKVVGVDIKPQPNYPFEFVQADVLTFMNTLDEDDMWGAWGFDAIHASPPCQAHTSMKTMPDAREHYDYLPETRAFLVASGLPYVIENVPGAPMRGVRLCGTAFGLGVGDAELRRHRLFEASFPLHAPSCKHGQRERVIGIYGEGVRDSRRKYDRSVREFGVAEGREAMGIDWMTLAELCQAIPPAYTEHIGRQLLTAASRLEQTA